MPYGTEFWEDSTTELGLTDRNYATPGIITSTKKEKATHHFDLCD